MPIIYEASSCSFRLSCRADLFSSRAITAHTAIKGSAANLKVRRSPVAAMVKITDITGNKKQVDVLLAVAFILVPSLSNVAH